MVEAAAEAAAAVATVSLTTYIVKAASHIIVEYASNKYS